MPIPKSKKKQEKMGLDWLLKKNVCVACEGSGKASRGDRKCVPCKGTGKRRQ